MVQIELLRAGTRIRDFLVTSEVLAALASTDPLPPFTKPPDAMGNIGQGPLVGEVFRLYVDGDRLMADVDSDQGGPVVPCFYIDGFDPETGAPLAPRIVSIYRTDMPIPGSGGTSLV